MNYFETLSVAAVDGKLLALAGWIYLVSVVSISYCGIKRRSSVASTALIAIGLATHLASFVTRWILCRRLPIANLFEYILLLTLITVFVYFAYLKRLIGDLGSVIMLGVVAGLLVFSPFFYSSPSTSLLPALRSYWLYIHVSLTVVSHVFFATGFVASMLYLMKHRLGGDDLSRLDRITNRAISIGFAFFTAGALVAGSIWAKKAWGSYWSWDPKEVMSLVVWLVYAVYLHARLVRGLAGVATALLSVLGFILIILTAISTIFLGGLHSYS